MFILNLTLFPSDGSRHNRSTEQNGVLLYYSKGSSSKKFPKIDLWVFKNGHVVYNEVYNVRQNVEIRILLSQQEVDELKSMLKSNFKPPILFKKMNELPLTTLKSKGKELEYHSSKINGPLKELDAKIEGILLKLLVETDSIFSM